MGNCDRGAGKVRRNPLDGMSGAGGEGMGRDFAAAARRRRGGARVDPEAPVQRLNEASPGAPASTNASGAGC